MRTFTCHARLRYLGLNGIGRDEPVGNGAGRSVLVSAEPDSV